MHTHNIWDLYREHNIQYGGKGIVRTRVQDSKAKYLHGLSISIYIYIYILKYYGPPADGGHPGGQRAGGHPGGRRTGGRYTADGHTHMLALWGEGGYYTEGAPTWRQGRCIRIYIIPKFGV